MYDGVGIANVSGRTVEIGAEGGDTIEMAGWFACNGNAGTPDLFSKFIMGSSISGSFSGSNNAVVVQHNHGASSGNQSVSHTHTIGNQTVSHTHTIDNSSSHVHDFKSHGVGAGIFGVERKTLNSADPYIEGGYVQSGGIHAHTQGNQSAAHSHTPGNQSASHNHVITVNNEGISGINANRPALYTAIYITRMS